MLFLIAIQPVQAGFHLMQIEQVIGGVQGDPTAQAIQLRMRSAGHNFVLGARKMPRLAILTVVPGGAAQARGYESRGHTC